ncbi:hypothetical protein QF037_010194 [Streptomyces canus]|nr:hypothetical protein [Streptomyces canus]
MRACILVRSNRPPGLSPPSSSGLKDPGASVRAVWIWALAQPARGPFSHDGTGLAKPSLSRPAQGSGARRVPSVFPTGVSSRVRQPVYINLQLQLRDSGVHTLLMSDTPRVRARQAELTPAQRLELDELQAAIAQAKEAFAHAAGRIAVELGRGGNSAVARHLDVTPQHISTLALAYKAQQADTASEEEVAA